MSDHRGWHTRGYLPHFDAAGVHQAITYRLADSLPGAVVDRLEAELSHLPEDERTRRRRQRIDAWLDQGTGSCCLRDPRCAAIVRDAWRHFAGDRYDLCAWVVMPNHVHVLIREHPGHPLPDLIASWKHSTACAEPRDICGRTTTGTVTCAMNSTSNAPSPTSMTIR